MWGVIVSVVLAVLRELVGMNASSYNAPKEAEAKASEAATAETTLADQVAAAVAMKRKDELDAQAIAARRAVNDERLRAQVIADKPADADNPDDGFCVDCGPAAVSGVAAHPMVQVMAPIGH